MHVGLFVIRLIACMQGCGQWVGSKANLWRTSGDLQANFGSVMYNIRANDKMRHVAKPGHFNDPGLMRVLRSVVSLT